MEWVVVVLLYVGVMLFGMAVVSRLGPRMGINMQRLTPAKKRKLTVWLTVSGAVGLLVVWSLSTGRIALGIGVLVAVMVLPEFVLIPLRIRRSRQRGEAARARREGRSS
jgi:hypothetical protein